MSTNETRFTEADLAPGPEERRAARKAIADRLATTIAVLSTGIWLGGMVALGACAAPFVFRLTPAPFSGDAMGAAFARFDRIALGAAAVVLGCEVVRTIAAGRRGRGIAARIRRVLAMVMAASAAYVGMAITPRINELHRQGAMRGQGPDGEELDRIHRQAELVGKAQMAFGIVLVGLHVFTLGSRRPEEDDEEDEDAPEPLAPGPRSDR